MSDGGHSSAGTQQLPDCDWCENEVRRLNGNVEIELCATCLHKGQCGYAPDKEGWRDRSVRAAAEQEATDE